MKMRVEGWDMDAFVRSGPVQRAIGLYCDVCIVFLAFCFDLCVQRLLFGYWS